MTTESKYTPTNREKLMRIAEYITRLAFWAFVVSFIYGVGFNLWKHAQDPHIPLYVKIGAGSFLAFLLFLFMTFLLDEEFPD